jgi:hypothetical protein
MQLLLNLAAVISHVLQVVRVFLIPPKSRHILCEEIWYSRLTEKFD